MTETGIGIGPVDTTLTIGRPLGSIEPLREPPWETLATGPADVVVVAGSRGRFLRVRRLVLVEPEASEQLPSGEGLGSPPS